MCGHASVRVAERYMRRRGAQVRTLDVGAVVAVVWMQLLGAQHNVTLLVLSLGLGIGMAQSFNATGKPGDAWDKRLLCVRRRTCVTGNCTGGGLQKALCAGHICTGFSEEQRDLRAFLNTGAHSAFLS